MSNRKPEETADLVLKALERRGQRGIVFSGWAGLQKADLPDSVVTLVLSSVLPDPQFKTRAHANLLGHR
jgi:hypothetical protein